MDARIFVLDAARANPFPVKGSPLAGGLALADVEEGSLVAFNAAPGTIAPSKQGPYGIYARALAEMLRYGGVPIDEAFARARLRANELSHGALVPWDASKLTHPIVLLAANPDAEALPPTQSYGALQSRAIRDFPTANEAYAAAIEIDTLASYQGFLQTYPSDPLAYRVRALLAARREALTWNRTVLANTPDAYWSYMRRYPRGPHFYDARRRLAGFSVSLEPPPRFDPYDFQGLPPPPEEEYIIVDRPEIIFEGPDYAPAPPPPPYFLAPPPPEFRRLPPPEPRAVGILPAPEAIPLPFARPLRGPAASVSPISRRKAVLAISRRAGAIQARKRHKAVRRKRQPVAGQGSRIPRPSPTMPCRYRRRAFQAKERQVKERQVKALQLRSLRGKSPQAQPRQGPPRRRLILARRAVSRKRQPAGGSRIPQPGLIMPCRYRRRVSQLRAGQVRAAQARHRVPPRRRLSPAIPARGAALRKLILSIRRRKPHHR